MGKHAEKPCQCNYLIPEIKNDEFHLEQFSDLFKLIVHYRWHFVLPVVRVELGELGY